MHLSKDNTMRKTIGALVLAAIAGISSNCAKPLTLNQNSQNQNFTCQPNDARIKEAAKYTMLLEKHPQFAERGWPLPYDITDWKHVRCLDQILRGNSDGRYGIMLDGEDYIIIETTH